MGETVMLLGIHGVGKTFLLSQLDYDNYSASDLIRQYKDSSPDEKKRVENIEDNQNILLNAIKNKKLFGQRFILDGHCCLLNKESNVEKIYKDVFMELGLGGIIVLYEDEETVCKRLKLRDQLEWDINLIKEFQHMELEYAGQLAEELRIPYLVTKSGREEVVSFINSIWR